MATEMGSIRGFLTSNLKMLIQVFRVSPDETLSELILWLDSEFIPLSSYIKSVLGLHSFYYCVNAPEQDLPEGHVKNPFKSAKIRG